jgi:hypothetical protein
MKKEAEANFAKMIEKSIKVLPKETRILFK